MLGPASICALSNSNVRAQLHLHNLLRKIPYVLIGCIHSPVTTWIVTRTLPQHIWVFAFFLQNNLLTAAADIGSVFPLYHFWTLAVQDQFYLVWPLLLWECDSNRRMRHLCYTLLVLSFLSRVLITHPALTPDLFGRILPSRAGDMCLGALIALEARQRTLLTPILQRAFLPLVLLCGVWMWHGLEITTAYGSVFGLQLIGLTCGALIVMALDPSTFVSRALGSKHFALGGKKLAFAMYILHPLVLTVCIALPLHSKMLRLGLFGVITVILSSLSYRFIESPILHLPIGRPRRISEPRELDHQITPVEDIQTAA